MYHPHSMKKDQIQGQLLMLGFDGTRFSPDIRFMIEKLKTGGFILFKRNIETPGQVHDLCMAIQETAKSNGQPPLFIAVDQEGGTVARFKNPEFEEYPGASQIKSISEAEEITSSMADTLKKTGINMNMAPVLDVAFNPETSIMKNRAYADTPEEVSRYGKAVISTLQKNGIMAVGKHFPGIGRTGLDSHLTLPVLETSEKELSKTDMEPFRAAIEADAAGIMLSHILYADIDHEWPASHSAIIADRILRNEMGFQGLVMTDDLDMKAIQSDIRTSMVQILKAGIDMSLICSRNPNQENALDEIMKLCRDNRTIMDNVLLSASRICSCKNRFSGH